MNVSETVRMSVQCGVSMQIIDAGTSNVLGGTDGKVNKTDTTKNIYLELMGATFTTSNTVTKTISYESQLVQLASYYALTNMLPLLDAKLMKLVPITGSRGKTSLPVPVSITERLQQLKDLYDRSLITKTDYEKTKQKILDALANCPP